MAKTDCASGRIRPNKHADASVPAQLIQTPDRDIFKGSREQLYASVPGIPRFEYPEKGCPCVTYAADGRVLASGGRSGTGGHRHPDAFMSVRRFDKRLFAVYLTLSESERRDRADQRAAELQAKASADAARREVASREVRLMRLPGSAREFSFEVSKLAWDRLMSVIGGPDQRAAHFAESGYSFADDDMAEIMDLASELFWAIRNARPQFNPQRRGRELAEARAKAARLDPALQGFLTTMRASAANDSHGQAAA